jgi:UDP-glucose 4-epimerase
MPKVLITGGFGYLGGRLARFLVLQSGFEIILGSRSKIGPPPWSPNEQVLQTRWDSPADLERLCAGIDAVVHLAGMNAHDCGSDPVAALEFNGSATARLLHAAIRQGVRRFVYLSTAHVYGNPLSGTISEETCPVSLHPYATSHRAGEDVVRAAHQRKDIEGIVIRLSNAYGAPAHKEANCWTLLVNDLCRQAVTTNRMVLRSSGLQRRDFITLTDACRVIAHLLALPAEKLGAGLFNVGGAWNPTVLEITVRVAKRVLVVTGKEPEILRDADKKIESSESLNYRIQKLTDTGFEMGGNGAIDREIDELIHFCIENVM